MDPETLEKVRQRMKGEASFPWSGTYDIIQIFSDSTQRNFCMVSVFTFPQEDLSLQKKISFIDQQIQKNFSKYDIRLGKIRLDQWKVLQYRILTEHQVLFKLFFINLSNPWIQLDYAIARLSYHQNIESIESSLGSVRFLKREKGGIE